jgi:formate dehydrogenase major subunit
MRPGTGAYPLRGHNNVQGASDNGSMPNNLPGYQSVNDPETRARFEAAWEVKLPSTKGLDNHEMVDAIYQGKLKSLYLIGEEMAIVDSNANYVAEAFSMLEFLVVQDIFFSTTCRFADVVLPACPSLEKEGTFTSTERRIQRLPGIRTATRQPPRLENYSGGRQLPRRHLDLQTSLRGHGRNRFAHSHVRGSELRAP